MSGVAPVGAFLSSTAFELDGNIKHNALTTPPWDWQSLFSVDAAGNVTGQAVAPGTTIGTTTLEQSVFKSDYVNPDASYFSSNGGGVKDVNSISNWGCTTLNNPLSKDNLLNAYAAIVKAPNGHFIFYAGSERESNNGDSFAGFWLFQDQTVGCSGTSFTGSHQVGDILLLSNYTNGGGTQNVTVLQVSAVSASGVPTFNDISDGGVCVQATLDLVNSCAIANSVLKIGSPWKPGNSTGTPDGLTYTLDTQTFVETAVDLTTALSTGSGGQCRIFTNFLAESRSSQELTATLKDFAAANVNFTNCPVPHVATSASQSSPLSVGIQGTVSDSATLSAGNPTYDSCTNSDNAHCGQMTFDLYGPTSSGNAAVCNSGDHVLGPFTESVASSAASTGPHNWTPSSAGTYYWVAKYLGDNLNDPSLASGCGDAAEAITVASPEIHILKTADDTTVNAGDAIGFTIKWWNSGPGTAAGVHVTDTLPTGHTWTLDSTLNHADCTPSSGTVTALDCSETTLGVGTSASGFKSVHVHSTATSADCANGISNTADVSTTNDGTDTSTATITVNCAAIHILKTADDTSVNAGDAIGFTIKWWNSGPGTAYGVHVTDTLPAGHTWTLDSGLNAADCTPSSGHVTALDCSEASLGVGSSTAGFKSVHVSSTSSSADCANGISNTADVSTTNDGSGTSTANITVNCAAIHILKTPDAASVNAGDAIGFTIKWWNEGPGTAYGVHVTDTLPTGHTWTLDSGLNAADCSPSSGHVTALDCSEASLAAGSSTSGFRSVHVSSTATTADCANGVSNTADVTTTNDGTGTSTANITVLCPDLNLTKTADHTAPVDAGTTIGFTVTLSNATGASVGTAYGVTLSDPLPIVPSDGGFSWAIASYSAPSGVTCALAPATGGSTTQTLNCGTGSSSTGSFSLAAGQSVTVHLTHATDAGSAGTYPNTATATCTNDTSCPLTASATEAVLVPDLSLTKTADHTAPVAAGTTIGFTVTLSNGSGEGTGTATGVTFTDPLPNVPSDGGFSWTIESSSAPTGVTCAIAPTSGSDQVLHCGTGGDSTGSFSLAAGQSVSVHVTHETDTGSAGSYDNTATVGCDNSSACPLTASATEAVFAPDIATVQFDGDTAGATSGLLGDTIHDTATVTNGYFPANGDSPDGTVTFALYQFPIGTEVTSGSCDTTPFQVFANVAADDGSGTQGSATYTSPDVQSTDAGVYAWVATYNGNPSNSAAISGCTDEVTTLAKVSPALTTTPSAGATPVNVGQTVSDTANLTGGAAPYANCTGVEDVACGTVDFALYNIGLDPTCTTNLLAGDAGYLNLPIVDGAAVSPAFTVTAAGAFQWVATYNGDNNNNAVSGVCGDTTEQFFSQEVQGVTTGPSEQPANTGGFEFALMLLGLPFLLLSFALFVVGRRRREQDMEEA